MDGLFVLLIGGGFLFLILFAGALVLVGRFYRKVDQGKALIINGLRGEPEVTFTGGVVIPIINRAEVMDISVKTIEIHRSGHEGLICKDNIRADIKVSFYVRVNKTKEDVLKVAQAIGCVRASDQGTLEQLFVAKFSEALKTVGKKLEFEQLYTQREDFKDQIIEVIGRDLNGYVLDDAAIDYLEQTPVEKLDRDNILDAQGIRKITAITAEHNVATNQLRQDERKKTTAQNLEADEAILELERRRADAQSRQEREIANVRDRENAETLKVREEERTRHELATIRANEEIEVNKLNMQRQVQVANKDRERVVAIKSEQVERDRQVEVIGREREVERQRIEKEMELEVKRKEIADVVRTRIVVDRAVAEEEERIKDLRALAEARRKKDTLVIAAQGEAEEDLVKQLKGAEAQEKVAEFKARERLVLANADLESAERQAKAKTRMAEGVQAEVAAKGLGEVKVQEAAAVVYEKRGLAEARVAVEQATAQARGDEEKGMAAARVRERQIELAAREKRDVAVAESEGRQAAAVAVHKMGEAEAESARLRLVAEAEGARAAAVAHKERLLAEVTAKEAEARVVEVAGLAEAAAIRARMEAEAAGLREKLEAMKAMEGAARDHEEFRMRLGVEERVRVASLETQRAVAQAQASVLAEAFGKANIQILGGDGQFLDKVVQASSLGRALDGFLGESASAASLLDALTQRVKSGKE